MVACALDVLVGPETEVEYHVNQVGNVVVLGVGGAGSYGHNGVNDSQGDSLFPIDWEILDPLGFDMPDEALVKTGVRL